MLSIFFELGFTHIFGGYDHLLFLAGLIIVTRDWRELLAVVSAFTVAHSTTLVLSAAGILSLNPTLTETLIAASIAYVGFENLARETQNRRWLIAGGFGLVHGAGFSGHLTDLLADTMMTGGLWRALIGFNLGIEAGQICVIAVSIPIMFGLRAARKWDMLVPEFSRAIAAVGVFLVIKRVWEL